MRSTRIRVKDLRIYTPLFEKNDVHVEDFKIEPLENKKIKRIINEKVKSVQRFCKGVIWLVT